MREIKFRAWDKVDGVMWEWPALIQSGFKILTDQSHVVMQYTGLKDKNGREIYEGDILEYLCREDNSVSSGPVEYEDYSFVWRDNWGTTWGLPSDEANDREVIGNIYENPKLISEKDS